MVTYSPPLYISAKVSIRTRIDQLYSAVPCHTRTSDVHGVDRYGFDTHIHSVRLNLPNVHGACLCLVAPYIYARIILYTVPYPRGWDWSRNRAEGHAPLDLYRSTRSGSRDSPKSTLSGPHKSRCLSIQPCVCPLHEHYCLYMHNICTYRKCMSKYVNA